MRTAVYLLLLFPIYSSAQEVVYDYDREADFSTMSTYSFGGWLKGSDAYINDLDRTRFNQAFLAAFAKRGFRYVEKDADVEATLYLVIDGKAGRSNHNNRMAAEGYRMSSWGMGTTTSTFENEQIAEGTLVLDIYDSDSKLLIWQGIIKDSLKPGDDAKERDRRVLTIVNKLMENFPPGYK